MRGLLALGEALDDLSEGCEGEIDGLELEEVLLVERLLFAYLLRAREIAKVQLPAEQHAALVGAVTLDEQLKDRVRAA